MIWQIAGYINGGSLDAPGVFETQAEIRVTAEDFVQTMEQIPRVPLIGEDQLVPGRRLWRALSKLAQSTNDAEEWQTMKEPKRWPICGSRIKNVDIQLNRAVCNKQINNK